jgi:glycine betaine/proline transport system ATP-binding protein
LLSYKDGPRLAVRKMEEASVSSIFVTDKEKNFKGLLTIDDAVKAYQNNISMEEMLITEDVYTTSPDTPLNDLIGIAANVKYPIVIVEDGKLLGIVSRVSILSGLVLGKEKDEVESI